MKLKVLFFTFVLYSFTSCYRCPGNVKDEKYIGVVINKYKERNHDVPYIQIKRADGTDTAFDVVSYTGENNKDLFHSISVGDSVFKPIGKYSIVVTYSATNSKEVFEFWCYGQKYDDVK